MFTVFLRSAALNDVTVVEVEADREADAMREAEWRLNTSPMAAWTGDDWKATSARRQLTAAEMAEMRFHEAA